MKKRILFFLLIILFFLTASFFLFKFILSTKAVSDNSPLHTQEMPVLIEVSDYIGLNLDNTSLQFGATMPGNDVTRKITIVNPFKENVQVSIDFQGQAASWLSISENNFILEPSKNKSIPIIINVPKNASFGNYTGILKLVMEKV